MRMIFYILLIVTLIYAGFFDSSFADTIIKKDGTQVKGLILEEYTDRIVMSTIAGEKELKKSLIKSAMYDNEERALMQKASNLFREGQYVKAYYTYSNVLQLNPLSDEARERLYYLEKLLETKIKNDVKADIQKEQNFLSDGKEADFVDKAKENLGIVLCSADKYVEVKEVVSARLKSGAGELVPRDRIVAVWGEMTAYQDINEVAEKLLTSGEIRITIERDVVSVCSGEKVLFDKFMPAKYRKIIGAELILKKQGIIVKDIVEQGTFSRGGIRPGDIIVRINGLDARYLPVARMIEEIEKSEGKKISISIRRDITLWKKENIA
ncbi:MAG: PDZ domain-containing protein [Candidatus Omnitrophota bacterium]